MKLLLWIVLAVLAVAWFNRSRKSVTGRAAAPGPTAKALESMVRCDYCGLHLPASEAFGGEANTVFCCAEHRALQARQASAPRR